MYKIILILIVVISFTGCAHKSLYSTWGERLKIFPSQNATKNDVSMLLGAPPTRCEPMEEAPTKVGIVIDTAIMSPIVISKVVLGFPAYEAGLRAGDIIMSIDGREMNNSIQAMAIVKEIAKENRQFIIETDKKKITLTPSKPKLEQCYWEVYGGRVSRVSGSSYIDRSAGFGNTSGASYETYFKATCRIMNGIVYICNANWRG